jgi:hypothetical protein
LFYTYKFPWFCHPVNAVFSGVQIMKLLIKRRQSFQACYYLLFFTSECSQHYDLRSSQPVSFPRGER